MKAFDTVSRILIVQKIHRTYINTHHRKWLSNILIGRHAYIVDNGTPSTKRRFPNGIPQGSVLSATSFNVFMHDLPIITHSGIHILSYVDEITIFSQH